MSGDNFLYLMALLSGWAIIYLHISMSVETKMSLKSVPRHKHIIYTVYNTAYCPHNKFFFPLHTLPVAVWRGHAVKIFCHGKLQNHQKMPQSSFVGELWVSDAVRPSSKFPRRDIWFLYNSLCAQRRGKTARPYQPPPPFYKSLSENSVSFWSL